MLRVFASAIALTVLCGAAAPHRPVEPAQGISPLDIIELQIGYTTILARYYKPVAPRVLVDGARTGIAADLAAHNHRLTGRKTRSFQICFTVDRSNYNPCYHCDASIVSAEVAETGILHAPSGCFTPSIIDHIASWGKPISRSKNTDGRQDSSSTHNGLS